MEKTDYKDSKESLGKQAMFSLLMTPPAEGMGPIQKMGNLNDEETEEIVEDIKERMEAIHPEIEYAGHGADGCVFRLDGQYIIKVMFPVVPFEAGYEVNALQILNEAQSPICPQLKAVGHIGPYRTIIKEDFSDMNGETCNFKMGSVIEFLEDMPSEVRCLLKDIPDANPQDFIAKRIDAFIKEYYEGDGNDEDIENNLILNTSFIMNFCTAYDVLHSNGITILDMSEENMGVDKLGEPCLRDLSRCLSDKKPIIDFSKDLEQDIVKVMKDFDKKIQEIKKQNSTPIASLPSF